MKNKAVNRLIALGTTLTILLCGCGGTEKPAVGSATERRSRGKCRNRGNPCSRRKYE